MRWSELNPKRDGNAVWIVVIAVALVAVLVILLISRNGASDEASPASEPVPVESPPLADNSTVHDLAVYQRLIELSDSYTEEQVYRDDLPPPHHLVEFISVSDPKAFFRLTPYSAGHPSYTRPHPTDTLADIKTGYATNRHGNTAEVIGHSCYYLLTDDQTFIIKLYYDLGWASGDRPRPNNSQIVAATLQLKQDLANAGLGELRIIEPSPSGPDVDTTCIDVVG